MASSGTSNTSTGCAANRRICPNMPGAENPSGLATVARAADGAGAAIQRVVEEIHAPLPAVVGFVLQRDLHRLGSSRRRSRGLYLQQCGFRRIEEEADRVLADDGGEHAWCPR